MAAARTTATDTPTPKEQDETGTGVAAADGSGVEPENVENGDKLVCTQFPHDQYGPIVVTEPTKGKDDGVTYTLTRAGVVVKAEHLQAVRDSAYAAHVKLRVLKAPTSD